MRHETGPRLPLRGQIRCATQESVLPPQTPKAYMRHEMSEPQATEKPVSRDRLAELLNEDLAREYQAIISYVVYSQVLKGAEYMSIASQLETHAHEELKHALIISRQIDYLGA